MKLILSVVVWLVTTFTLFAQDISGQWNGLLEVQGIQLRLVFHISPTDNGYTATLDSPDQGAKDIPVTSVTFNNPDFNLEVVQLGVTYSGTLDENGIIIGTFTQMGQSIPLNLGREVIDKPKSAGRPQEPAKPYPYYSEEVTFFNSADSIVLSGTLTLPSAEGTFPVVILISGSGPQNRNEELLGHKPFLIISDFLTRNGIGVLRYDDRGTAASEGDFKSATSEDFARDVESALSYLKGRKEIDLGKIGLIGHSEGGLIAPMVAASSEEVAFIVLLAGPGIPGYDILLMQSEMINRTNGEQEENLQTSLEITRGALDLVKRSVDEKELQSELAAYLEKALQEHPEQVPEGIAVKDLVESQVKTLSTPWMHFFLNYDPATNLRKVRCPVLALNGAKDLQVPPGINLQAIEKYLKDGGNSNVTSMELPNLNHLFQESETGSPNEYAAIEQTFSPIALELLLDWLSKQVN